MKNSSPNLDHQKLLSFFHEIMLLEQGNLSDRELGHTLLIILSTIFHYDTSTMWLKVPGKNNYTPVAYHAEVALVEGYIKDFYKLDPLNPERILSNLPILENRNVLTIKDVMNDDTLFETEYYREFLYGNQYCDEGVLYLLRNDELIGCIGILRSEVDGEFSDEDIALLRILGFYVTELIHKHFTISKIKEERDFLLSLSNHSPTGIIACNKNDPYTVVYMNNSALRYMKDFSHPFELQMDGVKFIRQYILQDSSYEEFGVTKKVLSATNKPYFITAASHQVTEHSSSYIYVYIIPQTEYKPTKNQISMEAKQNLTDRQLEVINCVLLGKSNEEIAKELFISISTVKTHLNNIYKELNVANRLSLYSKLVSEN